MQGSRQATTYVVTGRHLVRAILLLGLLTGGSFAAVHLYLSLTNSAPSPVAIAQPPAGFAVLPTRDTVTSQGLVLTYQAQPAPALADSTTISFTLRAADTGQPVNLAAAPSVWIGLQHPFVAEPNKAALTCEDRVKLYTSGTMDARPEIDLHAYFIITLNQDATISVIDPVGGVTGISQLYTMIFLKASGADWVMSHDGKLLFVTMPTVDQVAVIDTDTFQVIANIAAGPTPMQLALQPGGHYLWVANDPSDGSAGGVTIIDTAQLKAMATLTTGVGPHAIAFSGVAEAPHQHGALSSPASAPVTGFVTNQAAGTVSLIDAQSHTMQDALQVDGQPTSLAYSSLRQAIYVASAEHGMIYMLDAASHAVVDQIAATPGLQMLRFAPGGQWGFAVSPTANQVDIFDATTNRIVQRVKVAGAPDQIAFTAAYAYIHTTQKAEMAQIDLAQIGLPAPLSPMQIISGQFALEQAAALPAVAAAIVPIHGNHVLIAHPTDRTIYSYMEGMMAPMGSYQNYSRVPRAVNIIDRSLQETAPGVYQATIKAPKPGHYQVAFLLDAPRIIHCFTFTTAVAPAMAAVASDAEHAQPLALHFLDPVREAQAGVPFTVRFVLTDPQSKQPVTALSDITLLATLVSGQQSERYPVQALGQDGYAAEVILRQPGYYNLYIAIPSQHIRFEELPALTLHIGAGASVLQP